MRISKKLIKITGWVLGSLVLFYLLLLFVAGIFINHQQQRILTYISSQLQPHIRGHLSIKSIDVSPWTNFPSIDFRAKEILITDSLHQQPVLKLETVSSSFSLLQLIRGKTVISNVVMENGMLLLQTDSNGYSNSFLKNDTSHSSIQQPGNRTVSIEQLRLKDVSIGIVNIAKEKEISFTIHSLLARMDGDDSLRSIVMAEKITMNKGLGFNLAKGAFLESQTINGNWNVQYNVQAKTISFTDAKVAIGKQPFILGGKFSLQEQLFSIAFSSKQIDYALAKAVVSAHIRKKLDQYDVKKPLDADGSIEGSLLPAHEPAVNINWTVRNNTLVTEAGVFSNSNFTGNFTNSVDANAAHVDSNSRISFSGLRAEWNGIPFNADTCSITNLDSARLRVHLLSQCRLQDLDNTLDMQDIAFKSGKADFNLWYDGPIVRDKSMLQDIRGTVTIKDGSIDYTPRGFSFTRCNGILSLFKDSIRMDNFNCHYGDNVFDVALYGSNIRRTYITGDLAGPSLINCFVRTAAVNMDDFNSLFGQAKQRSVTKKASGSFAATAHSIDAALDNSTIAVHVKAAAIKRGNLHATNLDAVVKFEPQNWSLEKISMNIAGGSINSSGKILHAAGNTHTAILNVKIDNTDISKLLYAFDNFGQEAITYKELNGRFSTVASLQTGISSLGHIIPGTVKGDVNFSLQQGALIDYEPLNRLKTFVFKNRDLRHVVFAELKNKLKIEGETIVVDRMEIQSSAFRLYIEGSYGLAKKNTDLLIKVPFSNLNGNSFEHEEGPVNKGLDKKGGAGIWLRAVNGDDGKVKVKLTMNKKLLANIN